MIKNKSDLKVYLQADKIALGRSRKKPGLYDFVWKFEISLRNYEYCHNTSRNFFLKKYWQFLYVFYSIICGFEIPLNTCGKGLSLAHKGTIIISGGAKIGENCRIHACVNIGTIPGVKNQAATIGNDCYIGPGVKIFGKINIGNNTMIGANSVVNKSFENGNVCIAGVPARIISNIGTKEIINRNQIKYCGTI